MSEAEPIWDRDPSEEQAILISRFKARFADLHKAVRVELPSNRERSLALTNLEQAAMWATKATLSGDVKATLASAEAPRAPAIG